MNPGDTFIQALRQDTQLRSSFLAYLEEYKGRLLKEIPYVNENDPLRIAQGAIRGIDRLAAHIKKDAKGVEDEADQSTALSNGR